MAQGEWEQIPGYPHLWILDRGTGHPRMIAIREPYLNEAGGTKYVASGPGHDGSTHDSWDDATTAAEASLPEE